jgi:hypothetical protein
MAETVDIVESKKEQEASSLPTTSSQTGLCERLMALERLKTGQLRAEWRRRYRSQAPRLSRDLLIRGIAHRLQELTLGGMSKATLRKLAAFAKELEASGSLTAASGPQLRPGARLVREWRGQTHTVAVRDDGFEYAGTVYPSLTKIAEAITGAHWSGPRFFGLNDMRVAAKPPDDDASGRRSPITSDDTAGGPHG